MPNGWAEVKDLLARGGTLVKAVLSFLFGLTRASFRFTEKILISTWLLFLYFISIWLVLGSLTAFHLQKQVSQFALEEDIFRAIEAQQRDSDLQWESDRKRDAIRENIWNLHVSQRSLTQLTANTANREVTDGQKKDVEKLKTKIDGLNAEKMLHEQELAEVLKKRDALRKTYKWYFSDEEKGQKIRDLASDYIYMRTWQFNYLVEMPGFLLTLILSISMGALGSVIHLTWEFFDKATARRYSYYFFRPFLGGVLAFSIFILLKSGHMFLAGTPTSDAISGELNPFFISFLAIISGMLSQQAYERISTAGTRLLAPPEEEHPRWVRASILLPSMEQQQKTPSQLVPYVGETEAKIQEWFNEKEKVSEKNQSIISAWLGLSIRELFTEQEPEKVQKQGGTESPQKQAQAEDIQKTGNATPTDLEETDTQAKPTPEQPHEKDKKSKSNVTPKKD